MIFFINYCLIMLVHYVIDIGEEMTQHRHLREMGYDYAVPPFLVEKIIKEVKRYFLCACPFVNIYNMIELFSCDKYRRFDKRDVKKMFEDGEIIPISKNPVVDEDGDILKIIASRKNNMQFQVAELTKESLISQAYAIKLMNKNDSNNLNDSWKDLSTDRKIELILGILQDLYYDKAEEMGIDLDEELEVCEENLERNTETEEKQKKKRKKK